MNPLTIVGATRTHEVAMDRQEWIEALDILLKERQANSDYADELHRVNRANQVEYPSTDDPWFVPKMIGKGALQFLRDDEELNRDSKTKILGTEVGTPSLKEGLMFALLPLLGPIPEALGMGLAARAGSGALLNTAASLPFYAMDPDQADPLMDAAMGAGIGAAGFPGMVVGGALSWSPELEAGLSGDDRGPSTFDPTQYRRFGRNWEPFEYAGGGLVRALGKQLQEWAQDNQKAFLDHSFEDWLPLTGDHILEAEDLARKDLERLMTTDPWSVIRGKRYAEGGRVVDSRLIIRQFGGKINDGSRVGPKEIIMQYGGQYA